MMRLSVVIPTWRRPGDLERCLDGLERQSRAADEVVLVVREDDEETTAFLTTRHRGTVQWKVATLGEPGLLAALNRGLAAADGDVVAFTDDDTVPRPDWLERIEAHFSADPALGGVGGRDTLHPGGIDASPGEVGTLRWYGRLTGNHHLGVGGARQVDVLKGANMSYRHEALDGTRIDERLRGAGVQLHTEIDLCFALRRGGWKLVYDPAVGVDHYPSVRFEDDSRLGPATGVTLEHIVHNYTYLLLKWLPWWRRMVAVPYWMLVGTRVAPGLLLLIERLAREADRGAVLERFRAAMRGRREGMRTFRRARRELAAR